MRGSGGMAAASSDMTSRLTRAAAHDSSLETPGRASVAVEMVRASASGTSAASTEARRVDGMMNVLTSLAASQGTRTRVE